MIAWWAVASAADLTVWHAWRGAEEAGLEAAVEAYEAESGQTVELVALPFGAFDSKVETAVPRGNGPDLLVAGHGSVARWARMGLLAGYDAPLDGQLPVAVEAVRDGGRVYGAPLAVKSLVLLYDPTVVSTPPATTDDLLRAAHAATNDDRYGLVFQAAEPYFHAPWMHAFGAASVEPDGAVRLDTEAHARAYAFTRRLAVDEGVAPSQVSGEVVTRLYEDGRAAFVISGPWFVADLTRPIAAAPLPVVSETGQPARPYLTVDAAFPAVGGDVAGATSLAAFLAGERGARLRQERGGQAVTLASVEPTDPLVQVLRLQAESSVPMPVHPDIPAVWEAEARALRRVLRGTASPADAAVEAQAMYLALARPSPPEASPTPWLVGVGLVLLGLVAALVGRLRDPDLRAALAARRADYLWLLPAVVPMAALIVAPFVVGAAVSLFEHHQGEWTFVGSAHFTDILLAKTFPVWSPLSFWSTLVVTVLWTVSNVALHVGIGVALALLLREPWVRLRGVWRAVLIVPWAVPNYITALIWKSMFHTQFGAINALLGWVTPGAEAVEVDWFARFSTAFAANLVTNTWLGFPFMMVVTLGALQSIPRELEEAAELDGAGYLSRLRHVVWPLLRPALLPAVLMGSVWTFNMFNVVFLVSGGEPDGSTEILISDAYRWAFSRGNRYGYAAAYAVLIFGVLLAYSRLANRLVGRKVL